MLVSQILSSKSDDGVVSILPAATISEAAELMSSRRIGAVIVSSDGQRPLGILSERDIVRGLSKSGASCLSETVETLMTSKLVICSLTDNAVTVLEQMTEGRFRHLPVIEDGVMVGLISIGDVVKARLAELAMETDALQGMIMGH